MSQDARSAALGWGGLAALLLLACGLIWTWSPEMTILGDEWRYAEWTSSRGALDRGFDPDVGKYSIPIPLVVYQGLFETFGLDSHVPFRIMAFVLLAVVCAALYELLRRRVGYLAAIPPVALILFFGASAQILATSLRSPAMMSLAASLVALLLLERSGRWRDAGACILLIVAVACHPGGLAFCAATAVIVLARQGPLSQRALHAWVFAVPVLTFLVFLRPAPSGREGDPSLTERVAEAPGFLLDGVTGLVSRVAGTSELGGIDPGIGWLLTAILAVGIVFAVARRRPFPVSLVAFLTAMLVIVGAGILAPGEAREPNLQRYVLPAAVMLLLVIAELLREVDTRSLARGWRGRVVLGLGGALTIFAIVSNAVNLEQRSGELSRVAVALRAEALGFELARDLDPVDDAKWDKGEAQAAVGRNNFPVSPGQYYAITNDYGTPALSLGDLATEPEEVRRTARIILELTAQAAIPPAVRKALSDPA